MRAISHSLAGWFLLSALGSLPVAIEAQQQPAGAATAEAIRVFLDCNTFCDLVFDKTRFFILLLHHNV